MFIFVKSLILKYLKIMKKIIISLVCLFVMALTFTACRTSKPLCPAYRSAADIEMPKNLN